MQVLAMADESTFTIANESTCDGQRKYFHFLSHLSPFYDQ